MTSADAPGKMDQKIKKRNHAKKCSFLCLCYILRAGVENGAMLITYLFNASFRSQIFKIFFASGGKEALIP